MLATALCKLGDLLPAKPAAGWESRRSDPDREEWLLHCVKVFLFLLCEAHQEGSSSEKRTVDYKIS